MASPPSPACALEVGTLMAMPPTPAAACALGSASAMPPGPTRAVLPGPALAMPKSPATAEALGMLCAASCPGSGVIWFGWMGGWISRGIVDDGDWKTFGFVL